VSGTLRLIAAVVVGTLLLNFMDATLQGVLVYALADRPPADDAAFLAVRNRPLVSGLWVVTHVFSAALVGYIIGRIGGAYEVRLAALAAAALAVQYIGALGGGGDRLPPGWVLPAMLVLTPPALIAGAYVRGEARAIRSEQRHASPPAGERP
jgi:hypothetical protein